MIEAVIFDMDGLLINSEPLWRKAEIKVFQSLGIDFTEEMCLKTVGYRIDEVVAYWRKFYALGNQTDHEIGNNVVDELIFLIEKEGAELDGATNILKFFFERKIPVGLATSSAYRIIDSVLNKLSIQRYFHSIHSAESEKYGKPHPAVYLHCAMKLGVNPEHCLTFEDSFNGILSAKAARMKVIAIPEEHNFNDKRFVIADKILRSLNEFDEKLWKEISS